jgi:hypothetical protein
VADRSSSQDALCLQKTRYSMLCAVIHVPGLTEIDEAVRFGHIEMI